MFGMSQMMGASGPGTTTTFLVLLVLAVAALVTVLLLGDRGSRREPTVPTPKDEAEALLRRRLATGEIDENEYTQRLSVLNSTAQQRRGG